MLRFGETLVVKERILWCKKKKKKKKNWDDCVNNIVISKLVEIKNNSRYLIGYLDKIISPLVLILPKMSEYGRTFKVKDRNKNSNNILMSLSL